MTSSPKSANPDPPAPARRLVDDCFDPALAADQRLAHDQAVAMLAAGIRPILDVETLELGAAVGRCLAAPVAAPHDVPAHTNSAVDGYAVRFADYAAGERGRPLPIVGRAAAGHPFEGTVAAGGALRILTGAVLPEGVDTVAMQEDCTVAPAVDGADAQTVTIPAGLKRGANVRRAGEDVARNAVVFEAGHIIRPQDLAALASFGLGAVRCVRRPRVGIVSTGDEIIRPPATLAPGQVFDANAPMLAALARSAGADVTDLGVWPDRAETVRRSLEDAAAAFDVVITSGGASRGEEDHLARELGEVGSRFFWQINIKPGRPMMLGQVGDTIVTGLPGNPVAVFVCFLLYVWPMLRALGGAPWPQPRRLVLPAAFAFSGRKVGRREFWRGRLVERDGRPMVDKFLRDGSGLITGLRESDGLIDIPEDAGDIAPGDPVSFIPFSQFGFN